MISFIIRRLIQTVFLLIVVSIITFAIFFLIPRLAGQNSAELAAQYVGRNPTHSAIVQMEAKLGLNEPLIRSTGNSCQASSRAPTTTSGPARLLPPALLRLLVPQPAAGVAAMMSALPVTLSLAIGAAVLWLIGGVSIGVLSALRGQLFDRFSMASPWRASRCRSSSPGRSRSSCSATTGSLPERAFVAFTTNPLLWARTWSCRGHPCLPLRRAVRAADRAGMLETMGEDFVRTARAKGLPERTVVVRHGLRAALTPILTIFGMDLGLLLGGAVLTETTFSLPGLGQFTILAIQNQDFPEIMGVVLFAAFFIVVANALVDILYAVVDPRVRAALWPCLRYATCGSGSRRTTASSRRWTGSRSTLSAAVRSASSASQARARA